MWRRFRVAIAPEAQNVLVVACQDRIGIVAAVTKLLVEQDCSIRESSQCHEDGRFFMRLVFAADADKMLPPLGVLRDRFAPVAQRFGITSQDLLWLNPSGRAYDGGLNLLENQSLNLDPQAL